MDHSEYEQLELGPARSYFLEVRAARSTLHHLPPTSRITAIFPWRKHPSLSSTFAKTHPQRPRRPTHFAAMNDSTREISPAQLPFRIANFTSADRAESAYKCYSRCEGMGWRQPVCCFATNLTQSSRTAHPLFWRTDVAEVTSFILARKPGTPPQTSIP